MRFHPTTISGDYYLTRNGLKVEVYRVSSTLRSYIYGAVLRDGKWDSVIWESDGKFNADSREHDLDILGLYSPECPVIQSLKIKCECGHEKAGMPGHSTYCPKYVKI
jgi:hypothetical protein